MKNLVYGSLESTFLIELVISREYYCIYLLQHQNGDPTHPLILSVYCDIHFTILSVYSGRSKYSSVAILLNLPIVKTTFMSWRAEYYPDRIETYLDENLYATYEMLPMNHCQKCAAPIPSWMCSSCNDLAWFHRVYALGCYFKGPPYNHELSRHILDVKESRDTAKSLGLALATMIPNRYPELLKVDAIVPVPAHDRKLDDRGFNQADLLSIEVGKHLEKPVIDCLIQTRYYHQRNASSREIRFDNVKGAFQIDDYYKDKLNRTHLILVDDVFTSGATISECSKILMNCHARKVDAVVLGRTWSR